MCVKKLTIYLSLIQNYIKAILASHHLSLLLCRFVFISVLTYTVSAKTVENDATLNNFPQNYIELKPSETFVVKRETQPSQLFPTFLTSINNQILISNYQDIYVLDYEQATLSKLKNADQKNFKSWTPSGMHYNEKNKELFVSNELLNSIIVFSFSDKKQLTTKYVYSGFNEPKNIYCSKTDELVVANYSANKVSFYKRNLSKLTLLWEQELFGCHGVCILDNKVYACGVGTIACWDFEGKELYRCQSILGKDLLFPTSVMPLSDSKTLAVCDAKSGYCFLVTPQLKGIKYLGGNGIGLHKFNHPYSIYSHHDELVVTSVYQDRIAFINLKTNRVQSYCLHPNNWEWLKNETMDPNITINPTSNNLSQLNEIMLFENLWFPARDRLQYKEKFLFMPSYIVPKSLGIMAQPWYAISYAENENKLLLLANNSRIALLIDKKTNYMEFIDLHTIDCWGNGVDILTPQGKRHLDSYHFLRHTPEEFYQQLPFRTLQELAEFIGIKSEQLEIKSSAPPFIRLNQIIKERPLNESERADLSSEFFTYMTDTNNPLYANILEVFSFYALTKSKNYSLLHCFGDKAYRIFQKIPEEQKKEYIAYLKIILTAQPKLTKAQQEKLFDIMKDARYLTNILAYSIAFIKPKTSYKNRTVLLETMKKLNLENRTLLFKDLLYFSQGLSDKKLDLFIYSIIDKDKLIIDRKIPMILAKLVDQGFSSVIKKSLLVTFLSFLPSQHQEIFLNFILDISIILNKNINAI
ncbi:MAG: beta-propeller fold lactonase family protein [Candidatus Paracaedimonas acanthamoebae]|uniref:Beta-propeller fold lactonase family protein n=1 Tax=Candidatus Paracaedimonas acanthamoebae TaxID=244581 RepID=A0A8J7PX32_9PROT|nr:beta-propeller fold lactonase family protein [Candidatus Paracaedimonas acanthamoebae]